MSDHPCGLHTGQVCAHASHYEGYDLWPGATNVEELTPELLFELGEGPEPKPVVIQDPEPIKGCRTWTAGERCTNPLATRDYCEDHRSRYQSYYHRSDSSESNGRGSLEERIKRLSI